MFEAAHDLEIEWMVVKGIKGFADETQFSSKKWKQTACVMAASFVANILNHPVIFQDWPHLNAGIASCLNLSFLFTGTDLILNCLHVFLHILQIKTTYNNSLNKRPLFNKHLP